MKLHPVTSQSGGIVSMVLQAQFIGDVTDVNDQALIAAYGDPKINIGGTFVDPNDSTFTFQFPASEKFVGLTTEMQTFTARFMTSLPTAALPNTPAPQQGSLDCITVNPVRSAQVWVTVLESRITQAMAALRAKTVMAPIADATV